MAGENDKPPVTNPFSQAVQNAQKDFNPGSGTQPPATDDGNKPPGTDDGKGADGNKPPGTEDGKPPATDDGKGAPDPDAPPEGLSEAAKVNWKKTREEIKAANARADTLAAQLADQQAQATMTKTEYEQYKEKFKEEDITKLQESHQELEYKLAMADLSSSPKVAAKAEEFRKVRKGAETAIANVLSGMPDVEEVLSLDPKARDKKIMDFAKEKDIDARVLSRVWAKTDQLDEVRADLDKVKGEVKTDVESWKAQKEAATKREKDQARLQSHQLFQQGLQVAMSEKGLPQFYQKREGEGNELHNRLVDETINFTRKVATEPLNQQELTEVAFFAGVGKTAVAREEVMVKTIAAMKAERDTLQERVKKLESANPGGGFNGGGSGGSGGGADGDGKSTTPFMDKIKGEMASA